MDTDLWGEVLIHMELHEQCRARAIEWAAYLAIVPMPTLVIRHKMLDDAEHVRSFCLFLSKHVLPDARHLVLNFMRLTSQCLTNSSLCTKLQSVDVSRTGVDDCAVVQRAAAQGEP